MKRTMKLNASWHSKHAMARIGTCIATVGLSGLVAPSGLVWIAQHSVTSGVFYVIAAVRVAFGLVLVAAASASRAPSALRIMGYVIVIAGLVTGLTGLVQSH
jgi:hypothetical protein